MDVPSEYIVTGFCGLAAAVTVLWRQTVVGHRRCEERSSRLGDEIKEVRDRTEKLLVGVIRDNTASHREVVDYLHKMRRELHEMEPSSMQTGNYERQVLETNASGETTAILRKRK